MQLTNRNLEYKDKVCPFTNAKCRRSRCALWNPRKEKCSLNGYEIILNEDE